MKITLTNGDVTIIDDCDAGLVLSKRWHCTKQPGGNKYAKRKEGQKTVYLAREIVGATPDQDVDHINGDTLDNRRSNLRLVTKSQNMMNRRLHKNNTHGNRGLKWNKALGKWQAWIHQDKKFRYLGYFADVEDAKAVRECAEHLIYGQFAFSSRSSI